MRRRRLVFLLVAMTGCAAPQTDLGRWAKAKSDELRRLNEHTDYKGRYKFQEYVGGRGSPRQSSLYGFW